MDAFQAAMLGILQGITEWIPVSSQGQTMLAMMRWLEISPAEALSYSIFLHLGTMIAVLIKFRSEFLGLRRNWDSIMARTLVISTICTAITGIPLYLLFRQSFKGGREATLLIGGLLIITGLLLRSQGSGLRSMEEMKTADMVLLGLAQGLSILPGVSRSGITLAALLLRNLRQDAALTVSFMISVPAVLGAVLLDHAALELSANAAAALCSSLVTGYLAMDLLIRFAIKVNLSGFCIALGAATLLLSSSWRPGSM